MVGHREHRAGVALGQLAALDHREHVVRQLEQPDAVRDRRLRPADPLGDLAEREARTRRAAARSRAPPRSARGPRGRRSRRGRAAACRGRPPRGSRAGTVGEARLARGAPAALAGDQLVAALEPRPQRRPAGSAPARGSTRRGPLTASWSNRLRGCRGFGVDLLDRRRARARARAPPISTSKPRPRPRRAASRSAFDKLHRHLPVGLGAARAPVVVGHRQAVARRLGDAHRARHDRRRRRGRRSACAPRASTSAESRVRASAIVSSTPAIASRGFSRALIRLIDCTSCASPSSA